MKLYIVVLTSLSAGMRLPQAVHAALAFTRTFPEIAAEWQADNNVVVLQSKTLDDLALSLEQEGFSLVRFHEPDLGDQLTAICVEPRAQKRLAKVPLAA